MIFHILARNFSHIFKNYFAHCAALIATLLSSFRITECSTEIAETRRKRDADLKALEATTKELANMSAAEKQRIIVQISAVQTELKTTMDER